MAGRRLGPWCAMQLPCRTLAAIVAIAVAAVAVLGVYEATTMSEAVFLPGGTSLHFDYGRPFLRLNFSVSGTGGWVHGQWKSDGRSLVVIVASADHPETWFLTGSCGWPYNGTIDKTLTPGSYALYFFAGTLPDTVVVTRAIVVSSQ